MRPFWLAGAALLMAPGAQAADPGELGCMDKGYTPEQRTQLDALLAKVDLLAGGEDAFTAELGMLIGAVATTCADTLEWNDAEIQPAVLYEFGRLSETAVRRHGPLTADEVGKIDAALAKGDRASLWRALEEQIAAGLAGEGDPLTTENATLLGVFMVETGVDLGGTKPEQVGAFLATKAMQRISSREFAGQ